MKLLFLNNYYYLRGGSERVFFDEMTLLRLKEQEVTAFARAHENDIECETSAFFPAHIDTDRVNLSWAGANAFKEIVYSKTVKNALEDLLNGFSPDVAHAHNIYGRLTTSVFDLLHARNIPIVMTLHDYKLICPSYTMMNDDGVCEDCRHGRYYMAVKNKCHKSSVAASAAYAIESYFNAWCGKYRKNIRFFISPSLFLKKKLVEFGWDEKQIVYIPNFVALPEHDTESPPGDYLLYFGRLSKEKGVATLIRSFMNIKDRNARIKIAGDGPLRTQLESLAGKDSRISFEGYLSGKRLKRMIVESRAVVVPSEWYENAPLSVLEAMAFGKPVVGAAIGGIPEMVKEGVNGYLFESGHDEDLQLKLASILDHSDEKIARMGRASRDRVKREFSAENHYDRLMRVYSRTLESK